MQRGFFNKAPQLKATSPSPSSSSPSATAGSTAKPTILDTAPTRSPLTPVHSPPSPSDAPKKKKSQKKKSPSPPTTKANLLRSGRPSPLYQPEILGHILSFVDKKKDLKSCLLVSHLWYDCSLDPFWLFVHYPKLTSSFGAQLAKHGSRVRSLHIRIDCDFYSQSQVPAKLAHILKLTPRLKQLAFSGSSMIPRETTSEILKVIRLTLAKNKLLESLELCQIDISKPASKALFNSLDKLRYLNLIMCASKDLLLGLLESDRASDLFSLEMFYEARRPEVQIGDKEFIQIGAKMTGLKRLTLINYPNLSSAGIRGFIAQSNGQLTTLALDNCKGTIDSSTLADLMAANPFLNHIRLDGSRATDQVLLKLAAPAERAARLKSLTVEWCKEMTHRGLSSILQSCPNLEKFLTSESPALTMEVFEEPWVCTRLEELTMGAVYTPIDRLSDKDKVQSKKEWDAFDKSLKKMYAQISKLGRLRSLNLARIGTGAELFDFGRPCLESLTRLEELTVACHLEQTRTQIWLGTRFPNLKVLTLQGHITEDYGLLEDIRAINRDIKILCNTDPDTDPDSEISLIRRRMGLNSTRNQTPFSQSGLEDPVLPGEEEDDEYLRSIARSLFSGLPKGHLFNP
ncbi:hypothetical protein BGZ83_000001 [Gryganskiella cystojenkinii]|nr:hypothetical protein BGZ83_000001 [Gryganskiella cystojenkinii]